jgi:hypothetical protein
MLEIKHRLASEPFLFILKWLLLLAGLALTGVSLAFLNWGLGIAAVFLGVSLSLKGTANFINPAKQAVVRSLNWSALIFLVGGLVFYGLLFWFSLN